MLFSPPSIVKSALGVSEMMLEQDINPLEVESAQVQPINHYYFSTLPNFNEQQPEQQHQISQNNSHRNLPHYHQPSLSSNMLSQSISHQVPYEHVSASQLQHSSNGASTGSIYLQQHCVGRPTMCINSSLPRSSSISGAGGSISHNSNNLNDHTNLGLLYDKENLANGAPFLMLRNEDDLDLGGFQLSKSIFNQGQVNSQQPQMQMQQRMLGEVKSKRINNQKGARSFGTSLMNVQNGDASAGGYFGFDRTNVLQNSNQKSFAKMQENYMNVVPKQEPLDFYVGDSNSQASLPTTASSTTASSSISYLDVPPANNTRPLMDFLDLNDEYWLEFAQ